MIETMEESRNLATYLTSWGSRRDYNKGVCGIVLGEKEAGGDGGTVSFLVAVVRAHRYAGSSRRWKKPDYRKKEFREA